MSRRAAVLLWVTMAVASVACLLGLWLVLSLPHATPLDIESGSGDSAFAVIGLSAFLAVGGVILWHRPTHTLGWLYSISGLLTAVTAFCTAYGEYAVQVPGVLPGADVAYAISGVTFWAGIGFPVTLGLVLFPDGRPPSRRWWPVVALPFLAMLTAIIVTAFPPGAIADAANGVLQIVLPLAILASAASLIHRWRHARGAARQQLKWVVGAGLGVVVSVAVSIAVDRVAPELQAGFVIFTVGFSLLPIAVGIAIVRHGLYDIDLLIKRTVVYGATSAGIAAVFFGGIVALQALLRPLTSGSELAVAASTLVSLALFLPIRRRIRDAVDRRFDRSRYDAARTLDLFAERLRDEVDLGALEVELISAVRTTMAPTQASLWLRGGER